MAATMFMRLFRLKAHCSGQSLHVCTPACHLGSPSAKGASGTPTMGEATLMKVFGRMGVTRRNTM